MRLVCIRRSHPSGERHSYSRRFVYTGTYYAVPFVAFGAFTITNRGQKEAVHPSRSFQVFPGTSYNTLPTTNPTEVGTVDDDNNDSRCEDVEDKPASPVKKATKTEQEEHGDADIDDNRFEFVKELPDLPTNKKGKSEMAGKEDDHGDTDDDDSRTEVVEEIPDLPQHGVTDATAKKGRGLHSNVYRRIRGEHFLSKYRDSMHTYH